MGLKWQLLTLVWRVGGQVTAEALAGASWALDSEPSWAARTGTYVGCMFNDYMPLLLHGHGWPTSGPLLTGRLMLTSTGGLIHANQIQMSQHASPGTPSRPVAESRVLGFRHVYHSCYDWVGCISWC